MSEINVNGFIGMNNMNPSFYAKKGIGMPRLILNADVDSSGKIDKRDGLTAYIVMSNAHSLWSCEYCMLCAAEGFLYDISTGVPVAVAYGIQSSEDEPLNYAFVEDKVYISNQYWNGIYNPFTRLVSAWGIDLPSQPILISSTGGLHAGTYHVTLTNIDSVTEQYQGMVGLHQSRSMQITVVFRY